MLATLVGESFENRQVHNHWNSKTNRMHEADFRIGRVISCRNKMDRDYRYKVVAPYGDVKISGYSEPYFSPKEMLELGVFEGKYLTDCIAEYPVE